MLNPFILKQAPIRVLITSQEDNDLILEELEPYGYKWVEGEDPTSFNILQHRDKAVLTIYKDKVLTTIDYYRLNEKNKEIDYTVKDLLC